LALFKVAQSAPLVPSSVELVPQPPFAQFAQTPQPEPLHQTAIATPDSTTQEQPSALPAPPSALPAPQPPLASPAIPPLTEPSSMVNVSVPQVSSRLSTPMEVSPAPLAPPAAMPAP